ncbi:hypothetical protein Trydic_g20816 [Trypoxylus dichotomus]
MTQIAGITLQTKRTVPNRTICYEIYLPVPKSPENVTSSADESGDGNEENTEGGEETLDADPTFQEFCSLRTHLLSQGNFKDLVCDLKLFKQQSEFLVLQLKGWNLLDSD